MTSPACGECGNTTRTTWNWYGYEPPMCWLCGLKCQMAGAAVWLVLTAAAVGLMHWVAR